MDPLREAMDDSEVIKLAEVDRIGDEHDQLRCMENDRTLAMLKIKVRLKNLFSSIFNLANNTAMMIVIERNTIATMRRQKLTNRDAESVLNNAELSDVIAHKLISNFSKDTKKYGSVVLFLRLIFTHEIISSTHGLVTCKVRTKKHHIPLFRQLEVRFLSTGISGGH